MIKKVVYINYQPITPKYFSDYYLGECIENGLNVEYWDVTNLFFSEINFVESNYFETTVIKMSSLKELNKRLSTMDISSTFFITNINYEFRVWRLYRILTSFNCKLAFFARGMYPTPKVKVSSKVIKLLSNFEFKRILNGLKNKLSIILKKYNIIKTYDFVFRAGSEGGNTFYGNTFDLKKGKVIEINYFDYDKYLNLINDNEVVKEDYVVFMDQYLAYHPDVAICGLKYVDADVYYTELNNFFNVIEKKYNTSVVIAAHPKAIGYKTNNPFENRKIVFDKTSELVKDSKFALTHHSTAISFPILFKKPIVLLNSDELKKAMPDLYDLTNFIGDCLSAEVVNFDRFDINKELDLYVDIEKFNDYKYKYLSSVESENQLSSEIFIKTILKL
ncbi:hypothetical protein LNQ49_09065 [Flavobacterium sp. F-65]|uniref:Polysaccharide pyruvyl transferase n=1 Tax=Flavobacterium pisciphilum TaxID=2893755 RepID=A0ABS8MSU4_9FLAO|nr:hypothetical protein [Flavobacterium sp. F-65]MCC9071728.1 hypothetical protein [Flavobacterium sp. F-65]